MTKPTQNQIPEGWKRWKTKEVFSVKSGMGFKASEYTARGVRLLQIENVGYGRTKWKNVSYLPIEYLERYPELYLKEGDIVLALNRPVTNGKLKIAKLSSEDSPSILYQRVGKLNSYPNIVNTEYLYQISKVFIKKFVLNQSVGSDQPYIALSDLYRFYLLLPPLPEQHCIVSVLETWDKYLELLDKKIKVKKLIKKGLMQRLLSGELRLPGFSGEWKDHQLSEMATILLSSVDKHIKQDERKVLLFNYMDVYNKDRAMSTAGLSSGSVTESEFNKFRLREQDVLITKDSETPEDIARSCVVTHDFENVVCGYHVAIIRPKGILHGSFLKYYFDVPINQYYFSCLANGATRFGITKSSIEKATIHLPSISEQTAIADVLSSADEEIRLLEEKRKIIAEQKKFLLNNLITGKIRVP